jgi:glutamate N-acetyltransferase/amino-acid N-acetyltransferase
MSVTQPIGFRAAGATAGIKPSGKPDLTLIVRDEAPGCVSGAAMSFTRNCVVGAPVIIGREQRAAAVQHGRIPRAILINAGNSNAATGEQGVRDARACMAAAAALLQFEPELVVPSSTGVIGRPLPVAKITAALPLLVASLSRGSAADTAACAGIMTTDLVPKHALETLDIGAHRVTIGAIAKGSGMIAPRLDSVAHPAAPSATMLAFITTDAAIDSPTLQAALDSVTPVTFDSISVDNHASCSDTVIVLASGPGKMPAIKPGTPAFDSFRFMLQHVCWNLSEQIVTDGEGATRTFEVLVTGTTSDDAARRIAREIINSPLVKCAIHGRDPNWGRIVTAAGNAGVPFDPNRASLTLGEVCVYRHGMPVIEALADPRLKAELAAKRVRAKLDLASGPGQGRMLGCDLSAQYVSINADYTT